jgi:hypothetical protein
MSVKLLHFEKAFLFHRSVENPARENTIPEIISDAEGAAHKVGSVGAGERFELSQIIGKRKRTRS